MTIAPSLPSRLFATVETRDSGESGFLFRSDDSGESWYRVSDDPYIVGRPSDFAEVKVHPTNPDIVFTASRVAWKTTTGGETWESISPDLTRKTWDVPRNVGKYSGSNSAKPTQRGVVYALAPSPLDMNLLWAGTDDGLIHVTRDGGKTWSDVTPPSLGPWAKVSIMDASHFDRDTAYAAINTLRLDDLRPHILRTRDGGKTWQPITSGIPGGGTVNVVREDPKRRGLLFAGTETTVYLSNGRLHKRQLSKRCVRTRLFRARRGGCYIRESAWSRRASRRLSGPS